MIGGATERVWLLLVKAASPSNGIDEEDGLLQDGQTKVLSEQQSWLWGDEEGVLRR